MPAGQGKRLPSWLALAVPPAPLSRRKQWAPLAPVAVPVQRSVWRQAAERGRHGWRTGGFTPGLADCSSDVRLQVERFRRGEPKRLGPRSYAKKQGNLDVNEGLGFEGYV